MSERCTRWSTIYPFQSWKCHLPRHHEGPCPLWPAWWNLRGQWKIGPRWRI